MLDFLRKHSKNVQGVLSGWDRVRLRGLLAKGRLNGVRGMKYYLDTTGVLLKQFREHALKMTRMLLHASLGMAKKQDRPIEYLPSRKTSKEAKALEYLRDNPVDQGLICVLKAVEPCATFEIRRNPAVRKLELVKKYGACTHLYHYYVDPVFGFMHARIQTWFPFEITICLNGRHFLAQRMRQAGMDFRQYDNSFPWVEDFDRAQSLMDEMLKLNWPVQLNRLAALVNPAHQQMFPTFPLTYYWTMDQTEWATDVCFKDANVLTGMYPQLLRGAIAGFCSEDVMRFFGKRPNILFEQELSSNYRQRPEGARIKHRMDANSVKAYAKAGSILRAEVTINNPRPFRVRRKRQGHPEDSKQWLPMRAGVADQHRRAEVSQKCAERYLDALASLDTTQSLGQLIAPVTRRARHRGCPVRALHPWSAHDQKLFEFLSRPEHLLTGFRNADLLQHLFPDLPDTATHKRRASARASYRIRLLRAHGLIAKFPKQRRYRITKKGRQIVSAILMSQDVSLQELARAAA